MIETVKFNNKEAVIDWHQIHGSGVNCKVYEVVGYLCKETETPLFEKIGSTGSGDEVESIKEAQTYLTAYIKWDECSHFSFGDEDGYIHLCGKDYFVFHVELMKHLFNKAFELMDREPLYGELF